MGRTKPVRASETTLSDLMGPADANINGTVFGGRVLALVDKAAGVCAMRHSSCQVVTVAMERVEFMIPIKVGGLLIVEARIHYVGRSSMEIGVEVYAEDTASGRRLHTNSCLVTMVALDKKGRPAPVPGLELETPEEKERWAAAQGRRKFRLRAK